MRSEHYRIRVGSKKRKHLIAQCYGVLLSLLQLDDLVLMSAENLFYLVLRVIYPVSDFVGRRLIGNDIGTDKVFDSICTAMCFRKDMVDIPSAIYPLSVLPNEIVGIAVSGSTHKIAVKVFGILLIPKTLIPQLHGIGAVDFHLFHLLSKPE